MYLTSRVEPLIAAQVILHNRVFNFILTVFMDTIWGHLVFNQYKCNTIASISNININTETLHY